MDQNDRWICILICRCMLTIKTAVLVEEVLSVSCCKCLFYLGRMTSWICRQNSSSLFWCEISRVRSDHPFNQHKLTQLSFWKHSV